MSYFPAGGGTYSLGSAIGSTDTSILLSSFLVPVTEDPITMALLNSSIFYFTIAPKTTSSEFCSATGITQNANGTVLLTGVTRGLNKTYPLTSNVDFKLPHSGQSIVILSDAPQVFAKYAAKENDENITGLWNFTQTPTGLNPGAVPDASTTVKGIGKVSVAPVSPTSPIFVGDNDTRVPTQGENDALVGPSGTPSTTNPYENVNDSSNAVIQTSTTISFTAATKTIADSGNGFVTSDFWPGSSITVSGSVANNSTFTIVSVAAGAIVVAETVVDGVAGPSVTLTSVKANKIARRILNGNVVVVTEAPGNNTANAASTGFVTAAIAAAPSAPYIKLSTVTISQACATATLTKIAEFTGLTGDTSDIYEIDYEIVGTQASANTADFLYLRFNDSTGNYSYTSMGLSDASTSALNKVLASGATSGIALLFGNVTTQTFFITNVNGTIRIKASKTIAGTVRSASFQTAMSNGLGGTGHQVGQGAWTDGTNQITSLQLYLIQNSGSSSTYTGFATLSKIIR